MLASVWRGRTLIHSWWRYSLVQPLLRITKVKDVLYILYNSIMSLLFIYPKETLLGIKSCTENVHRGFCVVFKEIKSISLNVYKQENEWIHSYIGMHPWKCVNWNFIYSCGCVSQSDEKLKQVAELCMYNMIPFILLKNIQKTKTDRHG